MREPKIDFITHFAWRGKFRSFAAMIRYTRIYKHPTSGAFAAMVWELFSSDKYFAGKFAAQMYTAMGYKPFAGYPLTRSN